MSFRTSFCEPLKPDVIELGDIQKDSIIEKFESIDWNSYLRQMKSAKEDESYYSPSLEIENKDTKHGLVFSAVGDPANYEFYIFYRRPKKVSLLFGLIKRINMQYTTDKTGFTTQDALDCLKALIRNDTSYLADKIGQ